MRDTLRAASVQDALDDLAAMEEEIRSLRCENTHLRAGWSPLPMVAAFLSGILAAVVIYLIL